jgi:hypothetical protein
MFETVMVFLSVKAVIPTPRRPDTTSKSDRNVYSNDEYADREDEAVVRRTGEDKKEKRTRSCNPPTVQLRATKHAAWIVWLRRRKGVAENILQRVQ